MPPTAYLSSCLDDLGGGMLMREDIKLYPHQTVFCWKSTLFTLKKKLESEDIQIEKAKHPLSSRPWY